MVQLQLPVLRRRRYTLTLAFHGNSHALYAPNQALAHAHNINLHVIFELASFPGSRAREEEREPGTHCSRYAKFPW